MSVMQRTIRRDQNASSSENLGLLTHALEVGGEYRLLPVPGRSRRLFDPESMNTGTAYRGRIVATLESLNFFGKFEALCVTFLPTD